MKPAPFFCALALSVAAACAAGSSTAQDGLLPSVATAGDWHVVEGSDPRICFAETAPTRTLNTRGGREVQVSRGDIRLTVSYVPASNVAGEVAFTGGYPFEKDSTATLEIGGATFELVTFDLSAEGRYAWARNPDEDERIVAAMKRGVRAVVKARSSRGTDTMDTFSLIGATAMIEEAERRCGS